jgi:polysaccharide export outer membrane protein
VLVLAGLVLGLSVGDVLAQSAAQPPPQTKPALAGQGAKPATQPPSQARPASAGQGIKPADPAKAKAQPPKGKAPTVAPVPLVPAPPVPPPPGYVIGPDDVLQVLYWREKDVSAEVVVRPDGMISLPLLNDVKAAGLTPEQLRDAVNEAAKKFFEDPSVTINIKAINSRKVFITGSVGKPGPYALTAPTSVLQLIAMAGGLSEFAKRNKIAVMRTENGKPVRLPFNYDDVAKGKNLKQNIELKPGDTVIVP